MISMFGLINAYQCGIVAAGIGIIETGVCSWAIHKIVMDEQFLIFIIGHAMYKNTKNLEEAMAHYASLREYLRNDLFATINIIKLGLSIALTSGVILSLLAFLMAWSNRLKCGRMLWVGGAFMTLAGFATGFGLIMKNLVQNILYIQIFLAVTGVNFCLLLHLVMSILVQEVYTIVIARRANSEDEAQGEVETGNMKPHLVTAETETQTSSISLSMQQEFPLPNATPTNANSGVTQPHPVSETARSAPAIRRSSRNNS